MATSGSGLALLDTNVLVYATDQTSPQCGSSRALRGRGLSGAISLCVATPVLLEYVAVITDPRRVTHPFTLDEAWAEVEKYRATLPVLPQPADLLDRLAGLLTSVQPKGAEIFDLMIAATMLSAGVTTVYTYDRRVFGRVPGITALEP